LGPEHRDSIATSKAIVQIELGTGRPLDFRQKCEKMLEKSWKLPKIQRVRA